MKIGIAMSTYETKFGPIVLREGSLEEKLATASQLGYDGVDLFGDIPDAPTAARYRGLFEQSGLEIGMYVAIHLSEQGVSLSDPDPEKRARDVEAYQREILIARELGARKMPVGFLRGKCGENRAKGEYYEALAGSLKALSEHADGYGIQICLEPVNRYEIDTCNSAVESIAFLEQFGLSRVGLLLDAFHMNIEDAGIERAIARCAGRIAHFHLPDSQRLACGTGHFDYASIIGALREAEYDGYLTVEAFPRPSAYACARDSIACLKRYL